MQAGALYKLPDFYGTSYIYISMSIGFMSQMALVNFKGREATPGMGTEVLPMTGTVLHTYKTRRIQFKLNQSMHSWK